MIEAFTTRIIRSGKNHYYCQLKNGQDIEAMALPSLLKKENPVVGDYVNLIQEGDLFFISEIKERKNEIYRLIIRERKKKVIASNIDLLNIVVSVSKPVFKRGLLDRYLIRSLEWDIPTIVIFNKADELSDLNDFDLDFERKRLNFLGIQSFITSATHLGDFESRELEDTLKNKTSLFVGQSGVGKSKLISALSHGEHDLLSAGLAKVGKGAHTTTWAELLPFKNFSIVDSPGVRTMSMEDIFVENLSYYFQDIVPWIQQCKFTDCKHLENSLGCGFQNLDRNKVEEAIILSRLESYLRLYHELKEMPTWLRKKEIQKN